MQADHNRAYKIIVFMGLAAFALLWATSFALRSAVKPDPRERVPAREAASPFDASAASGVARALLAQPRAESAPAAFLAAAGYCAEQGRRKRLRVEVNGRGAGDATGALSLVLDLPGERTRRLLVLLPVTTEESQRLTPGSAANLGWMLEWGATVQRRRNLHGLRCAAVYVSNEVEPQERAAHVLAGLNTGAPWASLAEDAAAVLVLDGVGDCHLGFRSGSGAAQAIQDAVVEAARQLGLSYHYRLERPVALSAPAATLPYGVVVDFAGPMPTIEADQSGEGYCEASLQATADVLYKAWPALDHQLEILRSPT